MLIYYYFLITPRMQLTTSKTEQKFAQVVSINHTNGARVSGRGFVERNISLNNECEGRKVAIVPRNWT